MKKVTVSEFRKNIKRYLDPVFKGTESLCLVRSDYECVIVPKNTCYSKTQNQESTMTMQSKIDQLNIAIKPLIQKCHDYDLCDTDTIKYEALNDVLDGCLIYAQGGFRAFRIMDNDDFSTRFFVLALAEAMQVALKEDSGDLIGFLEKLPSIVKEWTNKAM